MRGNKEKLSKDIIQKDIYSSGIIYKKVTEVQTEAVVEETTEAPVEVTVEVVEFTQVKEQAEVVNEAPAVATPVPERVVEKPEVTQKPTVSTPIPDSVVSLSGNSSYGGLSSSGSGNSTSSGLSGSSLGSSQSKSGWTSTTGELTILGEYSTPEEAFKAIDEMTSGQ